MLWTSVSLGSALAAPGTDTTVARVAEWARDHHLGGAVTLLEQWQYRLDPPKSGGTPDAAALDAGGSGPIRTRTTRPATIPSQAGPALPGEGQWHPLYSAGGDTAAMVASLRPDAVYTSYVVHVVWLDPKLNSFVLHPGTKEPGPIGGQTSRLSGQPANTVLASFNSGFKMTDARGGYWQAGHTVVPLQTGAASMVLGTDGSLRVMTWAGGEPGTGVAAVRQNLIPLVHDGKVAPEVADPSGAVWGKTVGNAAAVWRSGIGTRADGSTVVVLGPSLTVGALAQILHDAGATEATQLDINKDWTSFITYRHGASGPVAQKLSPDEVAAADRYLQPSSRDFVAVMPHP
ncbi:phosphodiester glycosidase family protein [Raineyella sp. LH-20]|uniref:phosphodiester glycosidase family protein n=1 Tax=Raineyella sp. LH-20 TaxID=3081204 RepID=UPI002953BA39|nr:phosphodiester glycosidase family protein [Raineyella sp. LH-20]WOP19464.1 phosphodiester glycosidase family protein [Raineyella sp. LH-20]